MPQYTIQRGPRFGERVHLPQSQEVHLAVMLGDIVPVADAPAAAPAEPRWDIARTTNGADFEILLTLPSGEKHRYSGPTKHAKDAFKAKRWDGAAQEYALAGPTPPDDILTAYARTKGIDEKQAAAEAGVLAEIKRANEARENENLNARLQGFTAALNEGK
jgi:hypothetical protein